jgi:hypothetical protein
VRATAIAAASTTAICHCHLPFAIPGIWSQQPRYTWIVEARQVRVKSKLRSESKLKLKLSQVRGGIKAGKSTESTHSGKPSHGEAANNTIRGMRHAAYGTLEPQLSRESPIVYCTVSSSLSLGMHVREVRTNRAYSHTCILPFIPAGGTWASGMLARDICQYPLLSARGWKCKCSLNCCSEAQQFYRLDSAK